MTIARTMKIFFRHGLAVLALAGAVLLPRAAAAAGCAMGVMAPGKWAVTYEEKYTAVLHVHKLDVAMHGRLYGTVIFDVRCDGSATPATHYDGTFEQSFTVPGANQTAYCQEMFTPEFSDVHFSGTPNGFPAVTLQVKQLPGPAKQLWQPPNSNAPPSQTENPACSKKYTDLTPPRAAFAGRLGWTIIRTEATDDPATSRPAWLSGHAAWSDVPRKTDETFGVTMVPIKPH